MGCRRLLKESSHVREVLNKEKAQTMFWCDGERGVEKGRFEYLSFFTRSIFWSTTVFVGIEFEMEAEKMCSPCFWSATFTEYEYDSSFQESRLKTRERGKSSAHKAAGLDTQDCNLPSIRCTRRRKFAYGRDQQILVSPLLLRYTA